MVHQLEYINQILIFLVFAVSLNLLMSYAGQPSLAHAAFGAVGGYTAALLSIHTGVPFLAALVIAMAVGLAIGVLVSMPALALGSEFVILLTLAFAYIVTSLVDGVNALGSQFGLQGVKPISIFGHSFVTPGQIFWVYLIIGALVFAFCWRLGESPYGRVLKGLREDEAATRSLGKNTVRLKTQVFGVTSALAALGGAMFVYYYRTVSPTSFSLNEAIAMIAMVILGGSGNLVGAVLGAAIVQLSTPLLQDVVNVNPDQATFAQQAIYGGLLVLFMLFRPGGILRERSAGKRRRISDEERVGPSGADEAPEGLFVGPLGVMPAGAIDVDAGTAAVAAAGVPLARAVSASGEQDHSTALPAKAADGSGARKPPSGSMLGRVGSASSGDRREGEKAPAKRSSMSTGEPALVVRGLHKRFGGIVAVDGVDLDLPAQQVTALIGPNGAGKSTLFGLFTGFMPPDGGTVELHGAKVVGKTPNVVARMGMVRSFQDVRLFYRLSVLQNVMMAIPAQAGESMTSLYLRPLASARDERRTRKQAMEHLASVGMEEKAELLAGDLGHGEQKLVAIARVLATGADVLLLDEPTSGVDPTWVDRVAEAVNNLARMGKTVCIVEHNLSFLQKLEAGCYFLESGRIVTHGQLTDLMADEELRRAYFGDQARSSQTSQAAR